MGARPVAAAVSYTHLGIGGVINLLEGYGNDNPGAKSQGMKQLMAGGGVALIGMTLVPLLSEMCIRDRLYTLTYQKQYAFARHYLKDEQLAQDAVQETYILALKNLAKLKDPIVFVAWLNQIAFRTCFCLLYTSRCV